MKYKVAICQSAIIPGGRLRVLLGMIDILNEMGIEPDALTFKTPLQMDEIKQTYGKTPQVKFRLLPYIPMPYEFSVIFFNIMVNYFSSGYDLVINTNNSLIFLPRRKKVISYVFYPRESRVRENVFSIHEPEKKLALYSFEYLSRVVLRIIYRISRLWPAHQIISMTEFTKTAIKSVYPEAAEMPVVYPPVEVGLFQQDQDRNTKKQIVTIGRLAPDKRQLEQIRLAGKLPDFTFHIIGFAGNEKYYQECQRLIEELNLTNVTLHPGASLEQMAQILQESKYFLHTLISEPFGITAVQAIAAGCMPIVHNSGGQREVVNHSRLRFQDINEVPELIQHLEEMDVNSFNEIRNDLSSHIIRNFSDEVFYEKIREIFNEYLPDEKTAHAA